MTTKKGQYVAKADKPEYKPPLATGGRIGAIIPQDIEQVYRLAAAIAAANMAPASYNRDANAITIGIMHGMEVGFPPMAALQSIAVINGMPSIWGDGALGLVRSSGMLDEIMETIEGEGDNAKAICWVKRKGEEAMQREFSVADAKKAGLWSKKGPWTNYPLRMLQMRARSWALRDGFADVLRGLHIAEEAQDMGELVQAPDGAYVSEGQPPRPTRDKYTGLADAAALEVAAERQADADAKLAEQQIRTHTSGHIADDPEDEPDEETGEIVEGEVAQEAGPAGGEPEARDPEAAEQPNGISGRLAGLKAALAKQESHDALASMLAEPMLIKTVACLDAPEAKTWRGAVKTHREALEGQA